MWAVPEVGAAHLFCVHALKTMFEETMEAKSPKPSCIVLDRASYLRMLKTIGQFRDFGVTIVEP